MPCSSCAQTRERVRAPRRRRHRSALTHLVGRVAVVGTDSIDVVHDDLRASEDLGLRVDLGDRVFEGLPRETVGRVEDGSWNGRRAAKGGLRARVDLPM